MPIVEHAMSTQTADPAVLANGKQGDAFHAQPVGAVVPVLVQGSRLIPGTDQRPQPFAEESKTVVVFQNGAVLRISEGVGAGQLLILKNLKTNREVACRIVKANDKMKGYFEIEFTQPEASFWGVDFAGSSAAADARTDADSETRANVRANTDASASSSMAAPVEAEMKPATPADLAASTEELMEDLDRALASAFASLPKGPGKSAEAPKSAAAASSRTAPVASSIPANALPIGDSTGNSAWNSTPSRANLARETVPAARGTSYAETKKSREGDPGLALMADFVATDSFHNSSSLSAPRFETSVTPPRANWMWVVGGVAASVVLLAIGTGIYRAYNHQKPEDLLPPVTSSAPAVTQPQQGAPASATDTQNANAGTASTGAQDRNSSANHQATPSTVPVENAGTVVTATTSRRSAILDTKIKAPTSPVKGAGSGTNSDPSNLQVPAAHNSSDSASLGTLIPGAGSPAQPSAPAATRVSSVVQPRLLTSIPPSYPQIAATQRIEGDVKLDLTISEAGRVVETKVLAGPALLRDAAADAAKQWRYSPGKLDGSAVATHVIVTVHFELKQ
jgi:TonB family protein